jgi:hypothetical protein
MCDSNRETLKNGHLIHSTNLVKLENKIYHEVNHETKACDRSEMKEIPDNHAKLGSLIVGSKPCFAGL